MLLNIDKSLADLNEVSFKRLAEASIGVSAGSIAKLMLGIQNENIEGFYDTLKTNTVQAFLSYAEGEAVDAIGVMFNCTRLPGEDEATYKLRINKQNLTLASANETAVRLAILSIEGVEDVVMRAYTHGTGSFSVYPVTNNPVPDDDIMTAVEIKLDEMKGYGIRATAFPPVLVPVEMKARLIFDKTVQELDQRLIRSQAQQLIKDYVNTQSVGGAIVPNDLRKSIQDLNDGIFEVQFYQFRINNRPAVLVEQLAQWNERFIESSITDAILVS